jgi:hypothetical protein
MNGIRLALLGLGVLTLAFVASGLAGAHRAQPGPEDSRVTDLRYAGFRVVRETPGEPSRPRIVLPEGYELVQGEEYHVASRAEYYSFVQGPRSDEGIPVTVHWPDGPIEAVIWSNERLDLERGPEDPSLVTFRLPVVSSSPSAGQSTLQVWSFMETAPGISWRIEHNDPDRAAGPWTEVPWPVGEVRAVVHYLVASEAILRDSGLADRAAAKGPPLPWPHAGHTQRQPNYNCAWAGLSAPFGAAVGFFPLIRS